MVNKLAKLFTLKMLSAAVPIFAIRIFLCCFSIKPYGHRHENNRYFYGSSRGGIEQTKKNGSLSFVIEPAIIVYKFIKFSVNQTGEN